MPTQMYAIRHRYSLPDIVYLENMQRALTGEEREAIKCATSEEAEKLKQYTICPESWDVVALMVPDSVAEQWKVFWDKKSIKKGR